MVSVPKQFNSRIQFLKWNSIRTQLILKFSFYQPFKTLFLLFGEGTALWSISWAPHSLDLVHFGSLMFLFDQSSIKVKANLSTSRICVSVSPSIGSTKILPGSLADTEFCMKQNQAEFRHIQNSVPARVQLQYLFQGTEAHGDCMQPPGVLQEQFQFLDENYKCPSGTSRLGGLSKAPKSIRWLLVSLSNTFRGLPMVSGAFLMPVDVVHILQGPQKGLWKS